MELLDYIKTQKIAKDTMEYLKGYIVEGVSETEIVTEAERILKEKGAESFWYHNVGALVFVGPRTVLSMSGRDYKPRCDKVRSEDIVTVDLSPQVKNVWGDFARTFIISKGKVIGIESSEIVNMSREIVDYVEGIRTEEDLHNEFTHKINRNMTFEDVHRLMNGIIEAKGYENLDFMKNLGHSIETDKSNRLYIEAGNKRKIGDVKLFTFEPHIRKKDGRIGFKKEDIYYFLNGKLKCI